MQISPTLTNRLNKDWHLILKELRKELPLQMLAHIRKAGIIEIFWISASKAKQIMKMFGISVTLALGYRKMLQHTFQISRFERETPFWEVVFRPPVWSRNLLFWGKHLQIFNFF